MKNVLKFIGFVIGSSLLSYVANVYAVDWLASAVTGILFTCALALSWAFNDALNQVDEQSREYRDKWLDERQLCKSYKKSHEERLERVLQYAKSSEIRVKLEVLLNGNIKVTVYKNANNFYRESRTFKHADKIALWTDSTIRKYYLASDYVKNYPYFGANN